MPGLVASWIFPHALATMIAHALAIDFSDPLVQSGLQISGHLTAFEMYLQLWIFMHLQQFNLRVHR